MDDDEIDYNARVSDFEKNINRLEKELMYEKAVKNMSQRDRIIFRMNNNQSANLGWPKLTRDEWASYGNRLQEALEALDNV